MSVPKRFELARLELPVFNLLDCACELPNGESYIRWFPLRKKEECVPTEGEMLSFEQNSKSEQFDPSEFGYYRPCIRLRVRWIPEAETAPERADEKNKIIGSKTYARLQIPSLSISIIDSNHRREILQICASGIEMRHFCTENFTDHLVNVSTVQV